ncbi:hypothetical protein KRM28CT15_42370 [Krasilnikovia sp. M28-CT-15]
MVGERALAGSVGAVDGDPDTAIALGLGHAPRDLLDDHTPVRGHIHPPSLPNHDGTLFAVVASATPHCAAKMIYCWGSVVTGPRRYSLYRAAEMPPVPYAQDQ